MFRVTVTFRDLGTEVLHYEYEPTITTKDGYVEVGIDLTDGVGEGPLFDFENPFLIAPVDQVRSVRIDHKDSSEPASSVRQAQRNYEDPRAVHAYQGRDEIS